MAKPKYKTPAQLKIKQFEYDGLVRFVEDHKRRKPVSILGVPIAFDMETFLRKNDLLRSIANLDDGYGTCGTAACIAGHVEAYTRMAGRESEMPRSVRGVQAADQYGDRGASPILRDLYAPEAVDWAKVSKKIAAEATEHFLTTGKIAWPKSVLDAEAY